ncbi:helix-turn-helix domain-containing protein [Cumulibacter manganitolerans]|uniref:helix-turn-helix domain-containing protein n=1 Tax=Cumulibacter manganitolerans TaxID=1884992 RepID=UPI001E4209E6|nr:helix-turn-helix domain-containing protein [Cumulibacter manganitolerans]
MTANREEPPAAPELAALADPVRRRLYELVAAAQEPVRRDAAADGARVSRTLAAYHLDRLVEAGLLSVSYARPPGRGGPGAGRPAKLYRPTRDEVAITLPPRSYDVLAGVLADAVAADASGSVRTALLAAADGEGRRAADPGRDLLSTLRDRGYEPEQLADEIDLHNCPFHHLAQRHVELVCGLNLALLRGLLSARGEDPGTAELAPRAGHCCVTIRTGPETPA